MWATSHVVQYLYIYTMRPQSEESNWNSSNIYVTLDQHSSHLCTGGSPWITNMEDHCSGNVWRDCEAWNLRSLSTDRIIQAKLGTCEGWHCNRAVFESIKKWPNVATEKHVCHVNKKWRASKLFSLKKMKLKSMMLSWSDHLPVFVIIVLRMRVRDHD